ncbi:hypothetical protein [Luteibacter sp.]|uniref:hypothetical protein n=1 Tax=Luteibacter sp. TaxID=1886636 RepID=UPI003F82085B
MRITTLSIAMFGISMSMCASAQDAARSNDSPIESKSQTANSAPQMVNETADSKKHEQNQHWNDAVNTTHSRDSRKKDEYGSPVPATPKGQGTNTSTDAQRAADAKKH